MKTLFCFAILFCLSFHARSQSYEIGMNGKDTVNKIDANDQKQGKWLIRGRDKPKTCYNLDQVVETGHYLNNRKTGLWMEYYCKGKMRSKLTYVNGTLNGPAIFYNEKGEIIEEGNFKFNKWVNEKNQ